MKMCDERYVRHAQFFRYIFQYIFFHMAHNRLASLFPSSIGIYFNSKTAYCLNEIAVMVAIVVLLTIIPNANTILKVSNLEQYLNAHIVLLCVCIILYIVSIVFEPVLVCCGT